MAADPLHMEALGKQAEVRQALMALRRDALDRGMQELAIAYGWSAIRIGCDILAGQARG